MFESEYKYFQSTDNVVSESNVFSYSTSIVDVLAKYHELRRQPKYHQDGIRIRRHLFKQSTPLTIINTDVDQYFIHYSLLQIASFTHSGTCTVQKFLRTYFDCFIPIPSPHLPPTPYPLTSRLGLSNLQIFLLHISNRRIRVLLSGFTKYSWPSLSSTCYLDTTDLDMVM